MIVSKAQATSTLRYAVVALLMTMAQVSIARALPDAGGIKGTVKATTGATESAPAPIPGALIVICQVRPLRSQLMTPGISPSPISPPQTTS